MQWTVSACLNSQAKGGGKKKRFQYCLNPDSSGKCLYFRVIQGHSGDIGLQSVFSPFIVWRSGQQLINGKTRALTTISPSHFTIPICSLNHVASFVKKFSVHVMYLWWSPRTQDVRFRRCVLPRLVQEEGGRRHSCPVFALRPIIQPQHVTTTVTFTAGGSTITFAARGLRHGRFRLSCYDSWAVRFCRPRKTPCASRTATVTPDTRARTRLRTDGRGCSRKCH